MNNIKEYEKLRLEEKLLRKEYERKTDTLANKEYDKIDEQWSGFLYNIHDLLYKENKKSYVLVIDDYVFYFSPETLEIRIYKKENFSYFKLIREYLFEITYDYNKEEWLVLRNFYFDPETDFFNEWIKDIREFLSKTESMKNEIDKDMEEEILISNNKIKNTIKIIKEKLNNL